MSKSIPIESLIQQEHTLIKESELKHDEFFKHALASHALLQRFVIAADPKAFFFLIFLSQIRNHHLLAFLSTTRRHHVQCVMNLRQVLEAGASAAYAIGNHDTSSFAEVTKFGLLETPQKLTTKRYKWLEENYPKGSDNIKSIKDQLQKSSHANIVDGYRNFKIKNFGKIHSIHTPFFDHPNSFQERTDLWLIANIAMGLVDLFYGVSLDHKIIAFSTTFLDQLKAIEAENIRLKEIMMKTKKFIRADKIAKARDEQKRSFKKGL